MTRYTKFVCAMLGALFLFVSCKTETPEPTKSVPPPPAPVPVAEPVVPVDTGVDTDTDTATEPQLPPSEQPGTSSGGVAAISKKSLVGNYSCSVTSSQFPLGMKPPAAACKIYEGSGDGLKISPIGGMGITGNIKNIKAKTFQVVGQFNVGIGNLKINATLGKRSRKLYKGKGKGSLGDDGTSISFTLVLKKK